MERVAVPNLGNYTIALAAAVRSLGAEPWYSPTTPETMRFGFEAAPETACLPFKASLGHFMKAARDGVKYGVIVNSIGTCRLRYYRALQQKIIDASGLKIHIFGLGHDGFKPPLIRFFDPSLPTFLKGVARAVLKMQVIDMIELVAWRTRPRELNVGDTNRVMEACLHALDAAQTATAIRLLRRDVPERFNRIPVNPEFTPVKVALVGEASVLRDKYLNHNIEDILGRFGVEVFNFFLLGAELKKIFSLHFRGRASRTQHLRIARPYLRSVVGGHALETITHAIRCAGSGFEGIVHVCPTGCMPEISIRPILRKVSRDYHLPLLDVSFDEHTSHTGVVTRLEAFVDVLYENRRR